MLSSREQEQLNRIEKKLDQLLNKDKVDLDIDYNCGDYDCTWPNDDYDTFDDNELYYPHW